MTPLLEFLRASAPSTIESFIWPMLWQSSLLIGMLFLLDSWLRQRLRPAIRCSLWLVLLVKLLLPPSLALPTSLAWWLRPPAASATPTRNLSVVVTYGPATATGLTGSTAAGPVPPPQPPFPLSAWALLVSGGVSLLLLGVMLVRWRQIARTASEAISAPAFLQQLLGEASSRAEVRRQVRLKLTAHATSPALCGFLRPVILLPRSLAESLQANQLQAVLLHELIHLRRKDVWVNALQAVLQAAYWWHPLLWLANARIRRLREQAVDDAVMLALRDEAETYAPTLLEVAKLALARPLSSLGLVGIFESKTALRERILRLEDFRPPRKAGLSLVSALGILLFSALGLPMGTAPAPTKLPQVTGIDTTTDDSPHVLIAAKFIEIPKMLTPAIWLEFGLGIPGSEMFTKVLTPEQAERFLESMRSDTNADFLSEAKVTTLPGRQAEMQVVEAKTVVTHIDPRALAPPGVPGNDIPYVTTNMTFGPTLDIVAYLATNRTDIELTTVATLCEFLGYDKPDKEVPLYVGGRVGSAVMPLPHFRIRTITTPDRFRVPKGCSLLLANPIDENGRPAEAAGSVPKSMFVLITPTLVDPTGRPIKK